MKFKIMLSILISFILQLTLYDVVAQEKDAFNFKSYRTPEAFTEALNVKFPIGSDFLETKSFLMGKQFKPYEGMHGDKKHFIFVYKIGGLRALFLNATVWSVTILEENGKIKSIYGNVGGYHF